MFKNFLHESWSRFDDAFKTFDRAFDNKPSAEPVVTGVTEVRLVFKESTCTTVRTSTVRVGGKTETGECLIRTTNPKDVAAELRRVADAIDAKLKKP